MPIYGQFICQFSHKEGAGKPLGIHVAGEFVYVSDEVKNDITVYKTTSEYFTSIERETGNFHMPIAITSDEKCFYICDHYNNRIVIFCEFINSERSYGQHPGEKKYNKTASYHVHIA